jgi:hypothetical protein
MTVKILNESPISINHTGRPLLLKKIIDYLLINGSHINANGLNGKLSVALFFFQTGRLYDKNEYSDFGYDMFELLLSNEYGSGLEDLSFSTGISGIGACTLHLLNENYFEADAEELLEPIDRKIYQFANLPYDKQTSDINYLMGVAFYLAARIKCIAKEKEWEKLLLIENMLLLCESLEQLFTQEEALLLDYLPAYAKLLVDFSHLNCFEKFPLDLLSKLMTASKFSEALALQPSDENYLRLKLFHTVALEAAALLKNDTIYNRTLIELNVLGAIGQQTANAEEMVVQTLVNNYIYKETGIKQFQRANPHHFEQITERNWLDNIERLSDIRCITNPAFALLSDNDFSSYLLIDLLLSCNNNYSNND